MNMRKSWSNKRGTEKASGSSPNHIPPELMLLTAWHTVVDPPNCIFASVAA